MTIFNWKKPHNVYVDATISNRHSQDQNLLKNSYIGYVVEGLELKGEKKIDETESIDAELEAIIFALDSLEKKLKRFIIFCDHESAVFEINREPVNPKLKNIRIKKIRTRLENNPSIKVKMFKVNPAHTYIKKYIENNKLNQV
jgi:ribonuclease HI